MIAAAATAFAAVLLRISVFHPLSSDGANNALQGWDMFHGNFLLRGWILGDATYYTLELPLFGVVESVMGLRADITNIQVTIVYLLVLVIAMVVAKGRSTGMHAVLRCLAVLFVLAAPLASPPGPLIMLSVPIHFGTAVFMLLAFLIYDRAPWHFVAPVLLFAVLTLGQLGDATVLYCGVIPVILVGCSRLLFKSRAWSRDVPFAVAAALSVPAERELRQLIKQAGGYTMIQPHTDIVPAGQWLENAKTAGIDVLQLFGYAGPGTSVNLMAILRLSVGMLALATVVVGLFAVLLRWHRADPCEQLIVLGIGLNIGGFALTPNATLSSTYDLCFVLSGGAVLAARLVTPGLAERLADARGSRKYLWTVPLVALTAYSVILGLTLPPQGTSVPQLASFLQAHGLTYGLGTYGDASSVTLQSGNAVQVRAVVKTPDTFDAYDWETKSDWFDPAKYTANFVIANVPPESQGITVADVEAVYGQPERLYNAADRAILVYRDNLLGKVKPPAPGEG